MKFEKGDKIIVLLTGEEGKVVEIMNEKMVLVEVGKARFPVFTDQLDFPYFKMFSKEMKTGGHKQKVYIDNLKKEKITGKPFADPGMFLTFFPVFAKDVFDDDVVEKLKLYLVNQTNDNFSFTYTLRYQNSTDLEIKNNIHSGKDFYLHDVDFENISDNPRFNFEFSLEKPDKKKVAYYEAAVKFKARRFFQKLEEMQQKNEPAFSNLLFTDYPDKTEEEKADLPPLDTIRPYEISKAPVYIEKYKPVVDLHIEKLTSGWKNMSNAEMLVLQLNTLEKYLDLSVVHRQSSFIVIHGIGEGRLKEEIHQFLLQRKDVKFFENKYHPKYGYGATEIHFKY